MMHCGGQERGKRWVLRTRSKLEAQERISRGVRASSKSEQRLALLNTVASHYWEI